MSFADPSSAKNQRPELVFALVGAAGTRLNDLSAELKKALSTFGYQAVDIRLSRLLQNFSVWPNQTGTGEYERIKCLQKMGNAFRERLQRGDVLALAGLADIRAERVKKTGNQDRPAANCAYIIHQLKNPAEVDLLRRVYRPSFLLIAGHSPQNNRMKELQRVMAKSLGQSGQEDQFAVKDSDVITIDAKEENDYGQNVRDTYPRADFFANLGIDKGQHEVLRFIDLLFGHPFHTPNPDEYAMYL